MVMVVKFFGSGGICILGADIGLFFFFAVWFRFIIVCGLLGDFGGRRVFVYRVFLR